MNEARRSVVLHVSDDPADLQRAAMAATGIGQAHPELAVRVIVNGAALAGIDTVDAIGLPDGVRVEACGIGLERRGVDVASLPAKVEVIPGAVPALVDAQLAGAVYVRI